MITVMLVDDEAIEREGLRLILNNNRTNVNVIAEASDGEQAVENALKYRPDIIFMDIKMPGMDGVTAIQQILEKLPKTKCIMVTAFDTFEYAQAVMKYGVKEYLLKPSRPTKVLEAFDNMVAEIKKEQKEKFEKQELYQRLQKTASIVESEWIVSLMMDYVHDHHFEEWGNWLNLNVTAGFVAVFSFETDAQFYQSDDKPSLYKQLKYTLKGQTEAIITGPLIGFQVPVFIADKNIGTNHQDRKAEIVRTIIQQFNRLERKAKLIAGIGKTIEDLSEFSESYSEAIIALDAVLANPGSSYMLYHDKLEQSNELQVNQEKDLFEAVKQADEKKGLQLFDRYLQNHISSHQQDLDTNKKVIDIFFHVLIKELKSFGVDLSYDNPFRLLTTIEQVKEMARSQFLSIIKYVHNWRKTDLSGMLAAAKNYIDQSFQEKDISLERVANKVGVSPHYLSKLFKEHYQQSFIEYLTNLRLEKAKDYLIDPNRPLKEIALSIGYKDPNYFSRVFKKEFNLSPSEWRENNIF